MGISLFLLNKVKITKAYIPEKVRVYFKNNLNKEIEYFEKKYSFVIDFVGDDSLIIPEYKIELLNKSKKILDKVTEEKIRKKFSKEMKELGYM